MFCFVFFFFPINLHFVDIHVTQSGACYFIYLFIAFLRPLFIAFSLRHVKNKSSALSVFEGSALMSFDVFLYMFYIFLHLSSGYVCTHMQHSVHSSVLGIFKASSCAVRMCLGLFHWNAGSAFYQRAELD